MLGNIPNSVAYRRIDQYPTAQSVPGVLILAIDAPIYFANASYLRERFVVQKLDWHKLFNLLKTMKCVVISSPSRRSWIVRIIRWVDEGTEGSKGETSLQYLILDMGGK